MENILDKCDWYKAKVFSTGSKGYSAGGKMVIEGKEYQVCANVIEIGSKPKA
jgi:hypothetical protein